MEAHVCLYQTALGLLERGYQVFVAAVLSAAGQTQLANSLENMRLALGFNRNAGLSDDTPLNKDLFKDFILGE